MFIGRITLPILFDFCPYPVTQEGTKCIKCFRCDATFRHMCTYRRHVERMHDFTPEKRLKCDACGKFFNHREGLATHVKKFHTPQVGYPTSFFFVFWRPTGWLTYRFFFVFDTPQVGYTSVFLYFGTPQVGLIVIRPSSLNI